MSATRILDKTSSLGSLVAAMSCAGCFPALGSLGAALGLGFLGQYEGFLFRKLLPGLAVLALVVNAWAWRSEEHTSELQSLMRISYAVFCLKKKRQESDDKFSRDAETNV